MSAHAGSNGGVDFDAINHVALDRGEGLLRDWLPAGQRHGKEYKVGSLLGERGESLSIHIDDGVWRDFATNQGGSDRISLYAAIHGLSQGEAARRLDEELGGGNGSAADKVNGKANGHAHHGMNGASAATKPAAAAPVWTPIMPVPADAPSPPGAHYQYGEPTHTATIRDMAGAVLHYIFRCEPEGKKKQIAPLTYGTLNGRTTWHWRAPAAPRPLYGLDSLAALPNADVLLLEGEKKRDDGQSLLDDAMAVLSWPNGAQSPDKSDPEPLRGKRVFIWPDADEAGARAAATMAQHLRGIAASVSIVPVPESKDGGWDLSNAIAEGWTAQDVLDHISYAEGTPDGAAEPAASRSAKPDDTPAEGEADGLCQDDLAWQFAAEIAGRFSFDHTDRRWWHWDGDRWTEDGKESAFHHARLYCKRRRAEEGAPKELGKINTIAAVERAVRTDPRLATSFEDWDQDPWLLGVPGGAVDLKTGRMLPPDPTRRIRKSTAVRPAAPGTPALTWTRFLRDATGGDKEVTAFLQRMAGYVLTGDVSEEVMAFLYGPGGNGKGTFIGALTRVMGTYATPMPIEAFTASSNLKMEYYRARMLGARLVTASETEAGEHWSEAQIKELTGNETPISARHPAGRVFDFWSTSKLCIIGNHAPKLKERTRAMERRLRIVPFTHEPEVADPDLKGNLQREDAAILRWMLDGCAMWQRDQLGTAAAIQRATSKYFEQQDMFGQWLAERCNLIATLSEKPSTLHKAYNDWRLEAGDKPVDRTAFRETIERTKGLHYVINNGSQLVRGIGLRPPPPRQRDPN